MVATLTVERNVAYASPTQYERRARHREDDGPLVERKARLLAQRIADVADADQWAIAVVGHPEVGDPDFDELMPRWYLEGLSASAAARYRMTLVLQSCGKDLAVLRLGTLRPHGFEDEDVTQARLAVSRAAHNLAGLLTVGEPGRLT